MSPPEESHDLPEVGSSEFPGARRQVDGCCRCADSAEQIWAVSPKALCDTIEDANAPPEKGGRGGNPWTIRCLPDCLEDELDSAQVGFEDNGEQSKVGSREVDLGTEEFFTAREIALAARAWAWVSHRQESGACAGHVLQPGDLLQVLPGVSFSDKGIETYGPGDEGTVSRLHKDSATDQECVEVMWARTGLKSSQPAPLSRFRFVRRQPLAIGDLMHVLPGRKCTVQSVEVCRAGDEGTVSRFRRAKGDGYELVEVMCARTGRVCTLARASWMDVFQRNSRQRLEVGDTIQALPGIELKDDSQELYRPGDEGKVTCFYTEPGTDEDRMEVMWIRTSRKSDESAQWARWFRLVSSKSQQRPEEQRHNRFTASSPAAAPQQQEASTQQSSRADANSRLIL